MSQIYYEVSLTVEAQILESILEWLPTHAESLLQCDGFESVAILQDEDNPLKLKCVYGVRSRDELERYFENHAQKMRQEGLDKFGSQFTASRAIYRKL